MIPRSYNDIFFTGQQTQSFTSAESVLKIVKEWIRPNKVIDVGCGVGGWLKFFEGSNVEITGVDGGYVPIDKLLIDKSRFKVVDLEKSISIDGHYDLAICLEVAEHLNPDRAKSFVGELCGLSKVILFSAALPGQEGTLHKNEQYPDYWIKLFESNNYECFDCLRPLIWDNKNVQFWYKQNAMLFIEKSKTPTYSKLRELPSFFGHSIVHPDLFEYKSNKSNRFENILRNPLKIARHYLGSVYRSIKKR